MVIKIQYPIKIKSLLNLIFQEIINTIPRRKISPIVKYLFEINFLKLFPSFDAPRTKKVIRIIHGKPYSKVKKAVPSQSNPPGCG